MSFSKKFSEIISGWRNHIAPPEEIKALVEATSEERLSKCIDCPFNSTPGYVGGISRCTACGCWLKPKSKCLSCNCGIEEYNKKNSFLLPLQWIAVATEEQDTLIEKIIEDEEQSL